MLEGKSPTGVPLAEIVFVKHLLFLKVIPKCYKGRNIKKKHKFNQRLFKNERFLGPSEPPTGVPLAPGFPGCPSRPSRPSKPGRPGDPGNPLSPFSPRPPLTVTASPESPFCPGKPGVP